MKYFWTKWTTIVFTLVLVSACGSGGGGGGSAPSIPTTPGAGEGSIATPVALGTPPISHAGAVAAGGESYYLFTSGTGTVSYTISLGNLQSNLGWELYASSDFSAFPKANCSDTNGTADKSCTTPVLNASTTYYLMVYNSANPTGSTYNLAVAATPVPSTPSITATAGHLQNIISWTPVANATSYNLYWSTISPVTKVSGNKIIYASSPYVHAGVTQGTTYYYVVTAVDSNGESAESNEQAATPLAALSSFSTNFDTGTLQGWTASGTWGVTTSASYSPSYSVTDSPAGNYGAYANMSLTSPVIDLSSSATPTLSFYQKYDIGTYDDGYVEVSTDGGLNFTNVTSYNGTQSTFSQASLSLSPYRSSTVVVRFRFSSGFNVGSHDGWYLDDIVIQ